jgi:hypothetical protein
MDADRTAPAAGTHTPSATHTLSSPDPLAVNDPLAFTQLLLSVLDEGRRTATYKLAVLLALIDCCALASDASGSAPAELSTRQLARRVIELYWPQVRQHGAAAGVLRQSSQPRAVTVDAVARLYLTAQQRRLSTVAMVERLLPAEFERCLDEVELNLARMPLGKLQRPLGFSEARNAEYPRFLYDDAPFSERVTARQLPLPIRLGPGVGDALVSLAGLVRPLIELHWMREVARFNKLSLVEDTLREFLFGSERTSLDPVRPGLVELQQGRCFYCRQHLKPRDVHVDHFVPWSRIPNDGLANLVVADGRCNIAKSDNYADLDLLERWADRPQRALAEVSAAARWPLQFADSLGTARSLYSHLPAGSRLWTEPGRFTLLDPTQLSAVLPTLAP